jgi:hypothetical protein
MRVQINEVGTFTLCDRTRRGAREVKGGFIWKKKKEGEDEWTLNYKLSNLPILKATQSRFRGCLICFPWLQA